MTDILTSGLIRVLRADGGVAGTGFLISPEMAVTCTHVVAPLGSPIPKETSLRFYSDDDEYTAVIDATYCRPAEGEDISFLRLNRPVKDKIPLPLGNSNGTNGHEFDTFGFPSVNADGGIRGDGHVLGKVHINKIPVLQIDSKEVTPGFSGAPVLDKLTGRVIGMVTRIAVPDEYGRLRDVAFIIPSESLRAVLPTLSIEDACPYRGLNSFTSDPEDIKVFRGRERLTSDLVEQLRKNPNFLAVVGQSGSGKSSVVNAGLVPAIRSAQAGFTAGKISIFPLSKISLDDVLSAAKEVDTSPVNEPGAPRTVFVLDELEQFFVASGKAQETVIPLLAKLVKNRPGFTLVTAFRSDFYDPVFTSPLGPGLDDGQVNVRLMNVEELKSAIAHPAASVGLRFSEGLADDIAAEAAQLDNPLPLLEFSLTQLWEQRIDGELTREAYRRMKGVAGSIASWATDAFARLSESERKTARRILTRLIYYGDGERHDTRKRTALANLISTAEDQTQVLSVVMKLATARILTTDRDPGTQQQTVGLIHDALITQWEQLAEWIKERRQFLEWRQRLGARTEDWEKSGKDQGGLLRGQVLDDALRWQAEHSEELSPDEVSFVNAALDLRRSEYAARKEQEEQKGRSAFRLRMGIAAAVAAIVATLGAAWFWKASKEENALLQARQLIEESQRIAARQPSESVLLGVAALSEMQKTGSSGDAAAQSNMHSLLTRTAGTSVVVRQKGVNTVAISPDGKYFASAEDDEAVTMCSLKEATRESACRTISVGQGPILFVGFGADNRWLVVGSSEEWRSQVNGTYRSAKGVLDNQLTMGLLDLTAVQPRHVAAFPIPQGSVHVAGVSRDGKWLVTGEDKGVTHIWNLGSLDPTQGAVQIPGHTYAPVSAAFSPDGRWLAIGDEDHVLTLSLLDADGKPQKSFSFRQEEGRVSALAFSPDSGLLVLGTGVALLHNGRVGDANSLEGNATIKVLDLHTGQPAFQQDLTLATGEDQVDQIAISNNGRWLAAGTNTGFFRWDRKSLVKQNTMTLRVWEMVDEHRMPGDTMETKRFLNQSKQATVLDRAGTLSFSFAPDSSSLISGGVDGKLALWDLAGDNTTMRALLFNGHVGSLTGMAIWGHVLLTASLDGSVRMWNYRSGTVADYPLPLPGDERGVRRVIFSNDGHWAAVVSDFATVHLWNMDKLEETQQFVPFGIRVGRVAFSPDGGWLLCDQDLNDITMLIKLPPAAGVRPLSLPGTLLKFSDDGRWLVTGGTNKSTHLWDLHDPNFQQRGIAIDTGPDGAYMVEFAHGNQNILSIGYDKAVRFWNLDADKGKLAAKGQFTLPDRPVQVMLALSPEWQAIKFDPSLVDFENTNASKTKIDSKTSILLYRLDFEHGEAMKSTLMESEPLPAENALLSPDGRWLVTGMWEHEAFSETGQDAYARVYDLQDSAPGAHSVILRGHLDKLTAAAMSRDSKYLATGSADGAVKLWTLADIKDGKAPPNLRNSPEGSVMALEFDSGSTSLLASSKDGTARIWSLSKPGAPIVLSSSQKEVDQATMSPRGDWIATSGDDLSAWLWPASTSQLITLGCKAANAAPRSELEQYLSKDEAAHLCPQGK